MNRIMRVLTPLMILGGGAYFFHGAYLSGILNEWLVLDGESWSDPAKATAFIVVGGVLLVIAAIMIAGIRLERRLERLEEELRASRRATDNRPPRI